jgi:tryptophan synthase beta chain
MESFEAGMLWAQVEGYISAPETNQALACVVDEARKAKEEGKEKVILVNWSGHGLIDLGSYERYLSKQLEDYELPDEMLEKAEEVFKDFPKPALVKSR